ncbi:hypothetical protein QP445_16900, partial [Micrococcus luteus]|nr:hypothetical protein [Micrococcus luteus]
KKFDEKFNNKSSKRLSEEDFSKFDEFFTESRKVAPKTIRVSGYFADAEEVIFEHPKSVYKEYLASSEISVDNKALLR